MYIMLYIWGVSGTTTFVACSTDVTKLHRAAEARVKHHNHVVPRYVRWHRGKRVGTVFSTRENVILGEYVIERTKPL